MNNYNYNDIHDKDKETDAIPNEVLKPDVPPDVIKELLQSNYGLTVIHLWPLNGYDDLNFHVVVNGSHSNPHLDQVSESGYFLKVINLRDSQRLDFLDAQIQVMEHLVKKGIKCQKTVKGRKGQFYTKCRTKTKDGLNTTYLMTLRCFIPGEILHKIALTPGLLYTLGQYVADITSALKDFTHPFYETFESAWSLGTVPKLQDILFAVKDDGYRNICENVVRCFREEVVPLRGGFRKGMIHGDLNEQNIVMKHPATETRDSASHHDQICGLLDFQDSALSYPLYDLAICVCYMLMTSSKVPLLDIPGYVLAGYRSRLELTANERLAFRTCVAARMVQSLVMGAYTHHMDPSNDYVLTTSKHGWQALSNFWLADAVESQSRWDQIAETFKL